MKKQKFEAISRNGNRLVIYAKTIIGAKRQASDWMSAQDSVTLYHFNGPEIALKESWSGKWVNF